MVNMLSIYNYEQVQHTQLFVTACSCINLHNLHLRLTSLACICQSFCINSKMSSHDQYENAATASKQFYPNQIPPHIDGMHACTHQFCLNIQPNYVNTFQCITCADFTFQ